MAAKAIHVDSSASFPRELRNGRLLRSVANPVPQLSQIVKSVFLLCVCLFPGVIAQLVVGNVSTLADGQGSASGWTDGDKFKRTMCWRSMLVEVCIGCSQARLTASSANDLRALNMNHSDTA